MKLILVRLSCDLHFSLLKLNEFEESFVTKENISYTMTQAIKSKGTVTAKNTTRTIPNLVLPFITQTKPEETSPHAE